jgi:hypothetical protein
VFFSRARGKKKGTMKQRLFLATFGLFALGTATAAATSGVASRPIVEQYPGSPMPGTPMPLPSLSPVPSSSP